MNPKESWFFWRPITSRDGVLACLQFWMVYHGIWFSFKRYVWNGYTLVNPSPSTPRSTTPAGHLQFYAQPVHTTVNATSAPDPQKLILVRVYPCFFAVDFCLKAPTSPPQKKKVMRGPKKRPGKKSGVFANEVGPYILWVFFARWTLEFHGKAHGFKPILHVRVVFKRGSHKDMELRGM